MRRRLAAGLLVGVVAALAALAAGLLPLIDTFERKLYDQRVRWRADPATARADIVAVTIDETSVRRLEPAVGRWPWPRLVHASVIDYLARARARLVVYDVLFTEEDRRTGFDMAGQTWTGAESDQALADAVAAAGNVVLPGELTYEGLVETGADREASTSTSSQATHGAVSGARAWSRYGLDTSFLYRPVVEMPYPALAAAARGIGHNVLLLDPDGPVRRILPFLRLDEGFVPSLSVAAVLADRHVPPEQVSLSGETLRLGDLAVPTLRYRAPTHPDEPPLPPDKRFGRSVLIDFRGPAVLADGRSTTYPWISFADVLVSADQLAAGQTPAVPLETFTDRVVVIGATAAGLHDVFTVPFGEGAKMPGPLIHASVIDQMLTGRFIRPVDWTWRVLGVVALAVVGGVLFTTLPLGAGAASLVALGGGATWTSFAAFDAGWWTPLATPVLALAFVGFGGLAYRYFVEDAEKRAVKRLFSRYLSRDVYEQLLADPKAAELGGARRDMTVLFSDIRGFTALTERGQAEALVAQLNEYFSRMVDVVFANRGTLDKFVGDMVMALFGAPLDDPDHAEHAVTAALEMVDALADLNAKWAAEGRTPLNIGIGVNTGEMIAGNIGSERVRSYTVIGDAVNLGARLESLNKDYATQVIISETTAARLKGRYRLRSLGRVVVKGKTQPVEIFEVHREEKIP